MATPLAAKHWTLTDAPVKFCSAWQMAAPCPTAVTCMFPKS
jgi:hypothetical protein